MSFPKRLSSPFRYWRTRAKLLLQPAVWGSISVLILLILFSWEFWVNSLAVDEGQTQALRSQVDDFSSQLSVEDSIIGADIDNMASLIVDITQGSTSNPNPGVNLVNPSNQSGSGFFTSILGQQNSSSAPGASPLSQSISIPGAGPQSSGTTAAANSATFGTSSFSIPNTSPGLTGPFVQPGQPTPGFPFGTNSLVPSSTPATPAVSALQSAMTQYSQPQTLPSTAQTVLPGFSQFPSSSSTQPLPGQSGQNPAASSFPGQFTPSPTGNSSFIDPTVIDPTVSNPQFLPVPAVPTSSLRSAPVTPGGVGQSSQGTQQPTGFNPSSSSGTNTPTPQSVPNNPPPFSVPNSIGNGEINTFSNP